MTKRTFLSLLKKELSLLSRNEIAEQIAFYGEMIDDRIEEGVSESDAVAAVGSVKAVAREILSEYHAREGKPKRREAWKTALIVVGSPVWLSLLIAAAAVVISLIASFAAILISLYAALWSVIVSLWAAFVALAGSAVLGVLLSLLSVIEGEILAGVAFCGAAIVSLGLAIFFFYACIYATRWGAYLSLWGARRISDALTKWRKRR